MIVVDTNLIAHLLINGERTEIAGEGFPEGRAVGLTLPLAKRISERARQMRPWRAFRLGRRRPDSWPRRNR
ncbi:MAG: hypothetical protein MZV70_70500 [Desulfobacterales bacterium]|nr:hypothetical protein [Desulfobacterales bacterium]